MAKPIERRASFLILCLSPILGLIVGGLGAAGLDAVKFWVAAGVVFVILLSAWILGAREALSGDETRQPPAIAGGLLALVWSSTAIFAAMGPPDQATLAENLVRYPILMLDALCIGIALVAVCRAIQDTGERVFSPLALGSIVTATPLYFIFLTVQLVLYREMARDPSAVRPVWLGTIDDVALILFFFGAVLTYVSTAALAAAMGRAGWLRPSHRRVYVGLCLFALIGVGARILESLSSPKASLWGFDQPYALPGFVLMIPAVPWIMPCLLGFVLLRRAAAHAPE
ncbi:MAG: hypothetical protein HUU22_03460 [Phycisphaerae bacterium]|nr:hypothetical protein [Phycisphaerae bacterium]NUQ45073.1 hypothetical protein [Phycisphaerae bacterium]